MNIVPFARLMRLDKPIGIFLLLWPTLWALWIANQGRPPWMLLLWFVLGVILTRSAGCVLNDIADRRIDLHVKRTEKRPLTAGEVTLGQAFCLLFVLIGVAFLVFLQLRPHCFYYALAALCLMSFYPFCKRFLSSPQAVLALAFSAGIPMAYAASDRVWDRNTSLLVFINILWVLAYDTAYAWIDRADDIKVGVRSTALAWGNKTSQVILTLQALMQLLWVVLGVELQGSWGFACAWGLGTYNLIYQQQLMQHGTPNDWFRAFQLNAWYGAWMLVSVVTLFR